MKNFQYLNKAGFTLIELMVVIIIIGVVFGTIISASSGLNRRGRDEQRETDLHNIQSALSQYYADNQSYPAITVLTPALLASGGTFQANGRIYMANVPRDPSGTAYCYTPQIAFSNSSSCNNAVNSTNKCEYYLLYANLESPPSSTTYTCNGSTYNFSVNSP